MYYEMDSSEEYQANECKGVISEEEKKDSCPGCAYNSYCWDSSTEFVHLANSTENVVKDLRKEITGQR